MAPDPTAPATGDDEPTTETPQETPAPEAGNSDALKRALDSERAAAKAAKAEARDLKAQLQTLSEAKSSVEQERDDLKGKLSETSGQVPELETKLLKYEVAADKGLDLKLVSRLTGSTREELESDAEELKSLLGTSPTADDFDGGARRTAPVKGTPAQEHGALIAAALRAKRGDSVDVEDDV